MIAAQDEAVENIGPLVKISRLHNNQMYKAKNINVVAMSAYSVL